MPRVLDDDDDVPAEDVPANEETSQESVPPDNLEDPHEAEEESICAEEDTMFSARRKQDTDCLGRGFQPHIASMGTLVAKLARRKAAWQKKPLDIDAVIDRAVLATSHFDGSDDLIIEEDVDEEDNASPARASEDDASGTQDSQEDAPASSEGNNAACTPSVDCLDALGKASLAEREENDQTDIQASNRAQDAVAPCGAGDKDRTTGAKPLDVEAASRAQELVEDLPCSGVEFADLSGPSASDAAHDHAEPREAAARSLDATTDATTGAGCAHLADTNAPSNDENFCKAQRELPKAPPDTRGEDNAEDTDSGVAAPHGPLPDAGALPRSKAEMTGKGQSDTEQNDGEQSDIEAQNDGEPSEEDEDEEEPDGTEEAMHGLEDSDMEDGEECGDEAEEVDEDDEEAMLEAAVAQERLMQKQLAKKAPRSNRFFDGEAEQSEDEAVSADESEAEDAEGGAFSAEEIADMVKELHEKGLGEAELAAAHAQWQDEEDTAMLKKLLHSVKCGFDKGRNRVGADQEDWDPGDARRRRLAMVSQVAAAHQKAHHTSEEQTLRDLKRKLAALDRTLESPVKAPQRPRRKEESCPQLHEGEDAELPEISDGDDSPRRPFAQLFNRPNTGHEPRKGAFQTSKLSKALWDVDEPIMAGPSLLGKSKQLSQSLSIKTTSCSLVACTLGAASRGGGSKEPVLSSKEPSSSIENAPPPSFSGLRKALGRYGKPV